MFTWHEAKRRENLRKHGIDLADAERVFEGLTFTVEDDRLAYGEQRKATRRETHFYFSQIAD